MTSKVQALLHPTVRRFLDVTLRMPSGHESPSQVVDLVLPEVRAMLLRSAEGGMSLGGYDRDAAEAVSQALAAVVDAKCVGLVPGDPAYDDVLAGAVIGLGIDSGGSRFHGRYLRRFGSLSRILALGLRATAHGLLAQRQSFNSNIDAAAHLPVSRRVATPVATDPGVVDAHGTPSSSGHVAIRDLPVDSPAVRRIVIGDEVLVHGLELFTMLGYRVPSSSLSQFTSRNSDLDVFRMVMFPDSAGQDQLTTFLTTRGLFLVVVQVGTRLQSRPAVKRLMAGMLATVVPHGAMALDALAERAIVEAGSALDLYRRQVRLLVSRLARQADVVRDSATDAASIHGRLEDTDAALVIASEVPRVRSEAATSKLRAEAAERRVATLEEALDHAARAKAMADRDLAAARAGAIRWRPECGAMLMTGPRQFRPTAADAPDDGKGHCRGVDPRRAPARVRGRYVPVVLRIDLPWRNARPRRPDDGVHGASRAVGPPDRLLHLTAGADPPLSGPCPASIGRRPPSGTRSRSTSGGSLETSAATAEPSDRR